MDHDGRGQNWTFHKYDLTSETPYYGMAVRNTNTLYLYWNYSTNGISQIVGPDSYWQTTDLGLSWNEDTSFAGRVAVISGIGNAVWAAISSGDTLTRYHPSEWLALSYNGTHWEIDSAIAKGLNILGINFTDATHGWAVGNDTITAGTPFDDSTVAYLLKYVGPPLALGVSEPAQPSLAPSVLELSPNPATNLLHFQLGENESVVRCDVVNALGGVIECPLLSRLGTAGDVDISLLTPGMYELRVWTRAGCVSGSFIKSP